MSLFLGKNGSGKTTVFEVILKLQKFILGDPQNDWKYYQVSELFTSDCLTRWQDSLIQRFELEIEGNGGIYTYTLEVEHQSRSSQSARMRVENLKFNEQVLFDFYIKKEQDTIVGQARIGNDNPEHNGLFLPAFDWSRSGINFARERKDNQRLIWFKKRIQNIFLVQINPFAMKADSSKEVSHPSWDMSDYAAWYSYLVQENFNGISQLTAELQKIFKGFDSFQNSQSGDVKVLSAFFKSPSKVSYKLNELSEGQKVTIVLYTLLYCISEDLDCTLCIDEPESFLALPEIQPWLNELMERSQEQKLQFFSISHHPSLINYLALDSGYWFERQDGGTARVEKVTEDSKEGLSLAKLIELRWIYDE
ncbi:ATP-binding protein [Oscillatoria sp. FACHB-1406]|nr:ATP-binding protein [Oscillatoria sp. FACHB-1406]